jgi:sugar phosphate isomerase/epimerase
MAHLLSLAAGVLPEFPPEQIVRAAAEAGYRATGIWCDVDRWTDSTTRAVQQQLRDGALQALDIEVIWIGSGRDVADSARRLIDIGGTLGARNVLIVSANPSLADTKHQFAGLCELAAAAGMRAVLEFLMIAEVKTLAQALDVVTDVGHPAGGVLVDALHVARCGASPADVASIARDRLPYAQLCDGCATLSNPDYDIYLADAIDGRCAAAKASCRCVTCSRRCRTTCRSASKCVLDAIVRRIPIRSSVRARCSPRRAIFSDRLAVRDLFDGGLAHAQCDAMIALRSHGAHGC